MLNDVWEGLTRNRSIGYLGLFGIGYLDVDSFRELFQLFPVEWQSRIP